MFYPFGFCRLKRINFDSDFSKPQGIYRKDVTLAGETLLEKDAYFVSTFSEAIRNCLPELSGLFIAWLQDEVPAIYHEIKDDIPLGLSKVRYPELLTMLQKHFQLILVSDEHDTENKFEIFNREAKVFDLALTQCIQDKNTDLSGVMSVLSRLLCHYSRMFNRGREEKPDEAPDYFLSEIINWLEENLNQLIKKENERRLQVQPKPSAPPTLTLEEEAAVPIQAVSVMPPKDFVLYYFSEGISYQGLMKFLTTTSLDELKNIASKTNFLQVIPGLLDSVSQEETMGDFKVVFLKLFCDRCVADEGKVVFRSKIFAKIARYFNSKNIPLFDVDFDLSKAWSRFLFETRLYINAQKSDVLYKCEYSIDEAFSLMQQRCVDDQERWELFRGVTWHGRPSSKESISRTLEVASAFDWTKIDYHQEKRTINIQSDRNDQANFISCIYDMVCNVIHLKYWFSRYCDSGEVSRYRSLHGRAKVLSYNLILKIDFTLLLKIIVYYINSFEVNYHQFTRKPKSIAREIGGYYSHMLQFLFTIIDARKSEPKFLEECLVALQEGSRQKLDGISREGSPKLPDYFPGSHGVFSALILYVRGLQGDIFSWLKLLKNPDSVNAVFSFLTSEFSLKAFMAQVRGYQLMSVCVEISTEDNLSHFLGFIKACFALTGVRGENKFFTESFDKALSVKMVKSPYKNAFLNLRELMAEADANPAVMKDELSSFAGFYERYKQENPACLQTTREHAAFQEFINKIQADYPLSNPLVYSSVNAVDADALKSFFQICFHTDTVDSASLWAFIKRLGASLNAQDSQHTVHDAESVSMLNLMVSTKVHEDVETVVDGVIASSLPRAEAALLSSFIIFVKTGSIEHKVNGYQSYELGALKQHMPSIVSKEFYDFLGESMLHAESQDIKSALMELFLELPYQAHGLQTETVRFLALAAIDHPGIESCLNQLVYQLVFENSSLTLCQLNDICHQLNNDQAAKILGKIYLGYAGSQMLVILEAYSGFSHNRELVFSSIENLGNALAYPIDKAAKEDMINQLASVFFDSLHKYPLLEARDLRFRMLFMLQSHYPLSNDALAESGCSYASGSTLPQMQAQAKAFFRFFGKEESDKTDALRCVPCGL